MPRLYSWLSKATRFLQEFAVRPSSDCRKRICSTVHRLSSSLRTWCASMNCPLFSSALVMCIDPPLLIPLHILCTAPATKSMRNSNKKIKNCSESKEENGHTLSLLLRTAAYCGGTRTMWCGIVLCRGSHTLAGRFRLSVLSSATNWTVLLSFVGIVPSNLPIDINAWINSSSGASRGACEHTDATLIVLCTWISDATSDNYFVTWSDKGKLTLQKQSVFWPRKSFTTPWQE